MWTTAASLPSGTCVAAAAVAAAAVAVEEDASGTTRGRVGEFGADSSPCSAPSGVGEPAPVFSSIASLAARAAMCWRCPCASRSTRSREAFREYSGGCSRPQSSSEEGAVVVVVVLTSGPERMNKPV